MKRTDIHRPSAIKPSEYEYVGFECLKSDDFGSASFMDSERANIRAHMVKTGGTYSKHAHGGVCMVCGNANAIYTVLFHHEPTNTYVRMGQDCAHKCDVAYDDNAFKRFTDNVRSYEERKAGKAKAEKTLEVKGLTEAWNIYLLYIKRGVEGEPHPAAHFKFEESTIGDMVGKLITYGGLTDKQWAFMEKLLSAIPERAKKEEAHKVEHDNAKPAPEGRIEIEGEILSSKVVDGRFGSVRKILVKHADGWKVWGTIPAKIAYALGDEYKGTKVKFTATVEKSKDDDKFGFFSRPTKGEILETAPEKEEV